MNQGPQLTKRNKRIRVALGALVLSALINLYLDLLLSTTHYEVFRWLTIAGGIVAVILGITTLLVIISK